MRNFLLNTTLYSMFTVCRCVGGSYARYGYAYLMALITTSNYLSVLMKEFV